MGENNQSVIKEWVDLGGVLGYDIKRNGETSLYIMDDGEFEDRWNESDHSIITKIEFAKWLCITALRFAGCDEKEIDLLMKWEE